MRKLENELLDRFMPLIRKIAKSFNPRNITELDEYISLGQLGLVKAAQKYDPNKGSLCTIAYYSIKTEISNYKRSCRKIPFFDFDYDVANIYDGATIDKKDSIYDSLPPLSQEEKLVIDLYLQRYTFEEIGQKIGKSRSYTQNVYYRIIRKAKVHNGIY